MKFIHISNVNIGAKPDPDKFWSNDRANDIINTFAEIINICRKEEIQLLLISGNLFHHQPLIDELEYVNNLFKSVPNTKILIVAGNNDYISQNSPILNFKFFDNVYYFMNNFFEECGIDNTNIVVHGFSYYSKEEPMNLIDALPINSDNSTNILLCYAGDSNHIPFNLNKLLNKKFSYAALGLHTSYQELAENLVYYPGSPEPIEQDDVGEHGIIKGIIDETTHRVTSIEFLKLAKSSYLPISIKVNAKTTEDEVVSLVTREVIRLGNNNIFKIDISGMRNPDIEFSEDMFNKKIRIVKFTDSSSPKYDFVKLSSEHPQDMIGAFIRKMSSTHIKASEIEKNALYYGTHALIKSMESKN